MYSEFMKEGEALLGKICIRCGKSEHDVPFKPRNMTCEPCCSKRKLKYRTDAQKAASWRYGLKKLGVTVEQYEAMFVEQRGACAICLRPSLNQKLAVDHDHETGRIRGLLCRNCNVALGLLEDDRDRLTRAIEHLTGQRYR